MNYVAILVCGISNFLVGGLWYSVLFRNLWIKATKVDTTKMDKSGVGQMFVGSALAGLVAAATLAYLFSFAQVVDVAMGLRMAWILWVGMVCASTLGDYMFLRRGKALYMINMGLHLVNFTICALILSLWH